MRGRTSTRRRGARTWRTHSGTVSREVELARRMVSKCALENAASSFGHPLLTLSRPQIAGRWTPAMRLQTASSTFALPLVRGELLPHSSKARRRSDSRWVPHHHFAIRMRSACTPSSSRRARGASQDHPLSWWLPWLEGSAVRAARDRARGVPSLGTCDIVSSCESAPTQFVGRARDRGRHRDQPNRGRCVGFEPHDHLPSVRRVP